MAMDLHVHDTLPLWTPTGTCEIQLLYGDITKLPVKDKVDIIMVSAFPGDYAPLHGTVIGALLKNLGISTDNLARDRELDLRRQFYCWLSKPLAENYPYKKLLCFERGYKGDNSLVSEIRDMFRVFVPVFNNKDTTVITPLLATGDQNHSRKKVLSTMIECAVKWIQAGLPLKCFKIVIYGYDEPTLNLIFEKNKEMFMATNKELETKIKSTPQWDVFITYEPQDKDWAVKIETSLREKKGDLKIMTNRPDFDNTKVWQDQIFKLMSTSLRIIVVLTPAFIKDPDCLEQFNMAMCCSRMKKSNILLPFYMCTAESMPVYMNLVQYYDCRIRKENDQVQLKILDACSVVMDHLHGENQLKDGETTNFNKKKEVKFEYDIFISYSHKNPEEAKTILNMLQAKKETIKIFYDREELTMGSVWQKSLYHSLDSVKCVIALMSPPYLSSLVCKEEYNISLVRHLIHRDRMLFIPVRLADLPDIEEGFSEVKMVDGCGKNFKSAAARITDSVISWLSNQKKQIPFDELSSDVPFNEDVFESYRTWYIPSMYIPVKGTKTLERLTPLKLPDNTDKMRSVAICFAGESLYCPIMFQHVMGNLMPSVDAKLVWSHNNMSLHDLDTADQIVIFLSSEFLKAEDCMQHLHVALCRQRAAKGKQILHIAQISELTDIPTFVKLLRFSVSFKDTIWEEFEADIHARSLRKTVIAKRKEIEGQCSSSYSEFFAITKLVDDVVEAFYINENCKVEPMPNLANVVRLQKGIGRPRQFPEEIKKTKIKDNETTSHTSDEKVDPKADADIGSGDSDKKEASVSTVNQTHRPLEKKLSESDKSGGAKIRPSSAIAGHDYGVEYSDGNNVVELPEGQQPLQKKESWKKVWKRTSMACEIS